LNNSTKEVYEYKKKYERGGIPVNRPN